MSPPNGFGEAPAAAFFDSAFPVRAVLAHTPDGRATVRQPWRGTALQAWLPAARRTGFRPRCSGRGRRPHRRGDGATASGTEISGSLGRTWARWNAGVEGRRYAADAQEAGVGEESLQATLGMAARSDGTGLAFSLSPGWGARTSADDGLLDAIRLDGDSSSGTEPKATFDGRISWGMQVPGVVRQRAMLRPSAEFGVTEGGDRHLRTGISLEGALRTSLAAERRERAAGAENSILLRFEARF